jgi:N4-gp56 family major capsid protein
MAFPETQNSRAVKGLTPTQWDDDFFREYLTENRFSESMGTNETSIIQVREDLSKKKGDRLVFALVNRLKKAAVTGSNVMMGNEEDLYSRSHYILVDKYRNAVRVPEIEEQYSAIGLRDAARAVLQDWSKKHTEEFIIKSISSINGVQITAASGAASTEWMTNNADRILFGAARSNASSNVLATAAGTLDTTNDLLTARAVSNMKRIAETVADPLIRPIRSVANKGRRYYILYAHPAAFNDLKNDPAIVEAQRETIQTMENERLFEGGDLLWDGVIIKQIEQANSIWNFGKVGAAGANVAGAFLCGAQALGVAYARRWKTTTEDFDYGDKKGVEVSSIYGVDKLVFGSDAIASDRDDRKKLKDNGMVSGFFATTEF